LNVMRCPRQFYLNIVCRYVVITIDAAGEPLPAADDNDNG